MSMTQPLEGLLRPPLEWYSTAAGLTCCALLWQYPEIFMLNNVLEYPMLAVMGAFSVLRFWQGAKIWNYQRRLKRMPTYTMSSKQIPTSNKKLFIGRGFLWQTQHAQRLRDLDLEYHQKYKYPSRFYAWLRRLELRWEKHPQLKNLSKLLQNPSPLNPFRPYPKIGGLPCIHGVGDKEEDIMINLEDRHSHIIVLGQTRMGKTRLAELLIAQDIQRGDIVIVLDPKGDVDLLQRMCIEAKRAGREKDLLIFHLGFPKLSCRYNPVGSFTKVTQVATRLTNGLPATGEAAAFKEFAWRYVNLVSRALVEMGVKPTYKLIQFYVTKLDLLFQRYVDYYCTQCDPNAEAWINNFLTENNRYIKNDPMQALTRNDALFAYVDNYITQRNKENLNNLQNDLLIELFGACKLDKTYYDKITASIGPLLEKLTSGEIGDVLSPDYQNIQDDRPILDWLEVIRHKKIVYVGMDALSDNEVAGCVGNAMLADLGSVAGYLYKFGLRAGFPGDQQKLTPMVRLHADEVNEMLGDEFIPLVNKAGGAGFSMVAYTQTWSDIIAKLFSQAKAEQVAGNLGTLIMFRCNEKNTIDYLLSKLPDVPITRVIPASSSQDSPHGEQGIYYSSTNEDRIIQQDVKLITANDVINLPKGQAFCLVEGGKLYKLRMPLPTADEVTLPDTLAGLIAHLRKSTPQSVEIST